jgi:hypothetical protein
VALDPADGALVVAPPVGDGVRVPGWPVDDDGVDVRGVGVKIVGTADPPLPMHPDTVTARRTAPAAVRPANSHPLCAALGMVRRIFMNPPPL